MSGIVPVRGNISCQNGNMSTPSETAHSQLQADAICGKFDIHITVLPLLCKDLHNKGKVERHFRTLKERWLYTLDIDAISSLPQFNGLLRDYIRSYNTMFHHGINGVPLDRYEASKAYPRKPESRQWLDDCFYNRITRKVRKDSTVTIDGVCYDVPMQFISAKVDIRFQPDDMTSAFILFDDQKFPIRQTNRNENCHTKRNNLPGIDYSKAGGES